MLSLGDVKKLRLPLFSKEENFERAVISEGKIDKGQYPNGKRTR
jgi:hypothetical protein